VSIGLYQELRPICLAEMVGNETTVGALAKMLKSPTRPHAILFFGPSGCGKTTLGRILAHEFGSDENSIFEYNAANTRGIDTVREISAQAGLSSLGGKPKTYIIDECHELTKAAQEAFLKVLEEPPVHCYFVLCTTDPNSLILTVRNRCTPYEVSRLGESKIIALLDGACQKKGFKVDPQIVQGIACTCEGSPRAALVALETVKDITNVDEAFQMLVKGTEKDVQVIELCKLLYANPDVRQQKWQQIIGTFDKIAEEPETIRKSILTYLYKKLVTAANAKEALDLAHLIRIFSTSVFYGSKAQLGSLVAQACFSENTYLPPYSHSELHWNKVV